jgi:hypothetical protein
MISKRAPGWTRRNAAARSSRCGWAVASRSPQIPSIRALTSGSARASVSARENLRLFTRPPRPECAPHWHARLRAFFPAIELTLLVGSYAIAHYLPASGQRSMTAAIERWREFLPEYFVLPHPSWRTIRWLRDNPWFEHEALPELRQRVGQILNPTLRSVPYPRR